MNTKLFSALGMFLLLGILWTACQKEASNADSSVNPPDGTNEMSVEDRGNQECGTCSGLLSLRVVYESNGNIYPALIQYQDWHVKIEARPCPNQAWATVMEYDDDDSNAIGPQGNWVSFSPILHDQYYRITITNEDDVDLPILIYSRIQNASQINYGATGLNLSVEQGETLSFEYNNASGFGPWKGDCGCAWRYNCNINPGG